MFSSQEQFQDFPDDSQTYYQLFLRLRMSLIGYTVIIDCFSSVGRLWGSHQQDEKVCPDQSHSNVVYVSPIVLDDDEAVIGQI